VESDEDDDEDADPLNITPTKREYPPIVIKRPRPSEVRENGRARLESQTQLAAESKILPDINSHGSPSSSKFVSHTERADSKGFKGARSKKKRVVESEDEDESKANEEKQDSPQPHPVNDEEASIQESKQTEVSSKQAVPRKRKSTRGGNTDAAPKGRKGKPPKEVKEVPMKDERVDAPVVGASPQVQDNHTSNKRPRPKETLQDEEFAIDVGDVIATATATTLEPPKSEAAEVPELVKEATPPPTPTPAPAAPTQPLPKKRKLPTIKKTKNPGSAGVVAPLNSILPPRIPSPGTVDEVSKLPAVETRIPAANVGSADFDLRKPSVYAELFKSVRVPTLSHTSHFLSRRDAVCFPRGLIQ
jgi:hypothetical protein